MGQYVRRAWRELLRNIDVYLIVAIALPLSVLGIVQPDSVPVVLSAILATLAVLALSVLRGRQTDDKLETMLDRIAAEQSNASALNFFDEWDDTALKQRLETATEVSMLSIANYEIIKDNADLFEALIARGGKLRHIMVDPHGPALKMAADRASDIGMHLESLRMLNALCLDLMQKMAQVHPQGQVEVRLIDHLPTALITMIDPRAPNGVMFITLFGFGESFQSRPSFVLHKKRDGKWFLFYQNVYENMWRWPEGKVFDPLKDALPDPQLLPVAK